MIKAAGPPNPSEDEPLSQGSGGGASLRPIEEAQIVKKMLNRKNRWKVRPSDQKWALEVLRQHLRHEDPRVSMKAVESLIKIVGQNQADEHKAAPDLHLHAHQHSAIAEASQEIMDDPDYIEFLRQKALDAPAPNSNGSNHGNGHSKPDDAS